MIFRVLPAIAALSALCAPLCQSAPVHSGHASAEWITGATSYEPGKPLQTGFRLVVDAGWHTYWSNPGEAGARFKVVWNLPEGWTASDISYPFPKSIPGELPGYGYEGEVILPVTLTPPAGASGPVELSAKVSWLTCDDEACVPGKADVSLKLGGDSVVDGATAADLAKFVALVPKPLEGAKLTVRESGTAMTLSLVLPAGAKIDPADSEIFPETRQAIDHAKPIRFEKTGPTWSATATKNEYAEGPLKELKLVLGKQGVPPVEVTWKAE